MKIEKTTTGLIITEPTDEVKRLCLQYFSLNNPVREFFIYQFPSKHSPFKWKGDKETIFINSGLAGIKNKQIEEHIVKHMKEIKPRTGDDIELKMKFPPRSQLQKDCIKMMTSSKTITKLTIEAKPGVGKTYIALCAIGILKKKPLFIVPTSLLKNQWIEGLIELGIDKNNIASNIFDSINKDFCVVTVAALGRCLREDWEKLMKTIADANFGIKVIDESHLNLKGVLQFDPLCNIKYNWYMSATLGRSNANEDTILNRFFSDAERFVGNKTYEEYQKEYVQIYTQNIYYNPSRKLCEKHFKYGKAGLIRATYYNMLMDYRSHKYGNKTPLIENIKLVIKRMKTIIPNCKKILVLVPLISIIDKTVIELKKDNELKRSIICGIDGGMNMKNKQEALESDIILATSMSVGTGVDIKELSSVINFDQYASPIITEQIFGRLRDRNELCHYVDITDYVFYAKIFSTWGNRRRMILPYFPGAKGRFVNLPPIKS